MNKDVSIYLLTSFCYIVWRNKMDNVDISKEKLIKEEKRILKLKHRKFETRQELYKKMWESNIRHLI